MMTYRIILKMDDCNEEFLASGKDTDMMIDTFNRMVHNIKKNLPDCECTLTLYEDGEVSREYHQKGE